MVFLLSSYALLEAPRAELPPSAYLIVQALAPVITVAAVSQGLSLHRSG